MNDVYLPAKQVTEKYKISVSTLRRLADEGKILVKRSPGGKRYYNVDSIFKDGPQHPPKPDNKIKYAYCRVSSNKQSDDLQRQQQAISKLYPNHVILSDIGSGINFKRKNFNSILEDTINGKVEELIIAHRDRLSRFNFELLETIFKMCNTKLIVLDKDDHKSSESELAEDLLSIVHVFSCREMGKRRYSGTKKEKQ